MNTRDEIRYAIDHDLLDLLDGDTVQALLAVADAARALLAEVPDGFDTTAPHQDRVDAVFANLTDALAVFEVEP